MSTVEANLPEETEKYLAEKKVPALMEHLYRELVLAMPGDPLEHLIKVLENPITPKVIIAGPPAGGKGTQCEQIAEKYGAMHGDVVRFIKGATQLFGEDLGLFFYFVAFYDLILHI